MEFAVVTLFPQMLRALEVGGITARAMERGLVRVEAVNPRDFTLDRHRTVDDRPYGGGPGMVMLAEPLSAAIRAAKRRLGGGRVIHLSPQGGRLDQARVRALIECERLVLVCGRYEGIDERVVSSDVDEEISVGDYVLSGGELAAMVVIEATCRWLPGALGHADSAAQDSFSAGLLDCPHYSRPEVVEGRAVPAVLLGGDHGTIRRWRLKQSLGRTWRRRPDLLEATTLDVEQRRLLDEYVEESKSGAPGNGCTE